MMFLSGELDINSLEFAKQFKTIIEDLTEKKFKELWKKNTNWSVGKVVTSANTATIQLYINNSTTAVEVKNPRSFSLTTGQLVVVSSPNNKDDNMRYIDRVL